MNPLLAIPLIFLTTLASAQGKADNELSQFLRTHKIDNFISIRSGCTNCTISYETTAKVADTVTIWLLYKTHGKQSLVHFSDLGQAMQSKKVDTDIFNFVADNKKLLMKMNQYYEEQKLWKFQAPCFATFPFETIEISMGTFKHRHTLVKWEWDDCGNNLTNEDWFQVEVKLVKMFDQLSNNIW